MNSAHSTHCHTRPNHSQSSNGMASGRTGLTGMKLRGRCVYSVDESGLLRVVRLVLRRHQHTVSKTSDLKQDTVLSTRRQPYLGGVVDHSLGEGIGDGVLASVGVPSHGLKDRRSGCSHWTGYRFRGANELPGVDGIVHVAA